MTHNKEPFEDSLRRGLSRLADGAPAGPTAGKIVARLQRRTRHRRNFAGAAAGGAVLAVAIVCAVMIHRFESSPAIAPGGHGGAIPIARAKTLTDEGIREAVRREALAARLVASNAILARAPGSQDDVRTMRHFVLSQYGDTMAAQAMDHLNQSTQGNTP